MGLFKKILDKMSRGCFYVIDMDTLQKYLQEELDFSLSNNLEASADLNLYVNGEKHHIQIWNYAASSFKSEKVKGLVIYYDKDEYRTLEELYRNKLNNIPKYFKIEVPNFDNQKLEKYKEEHPELKIEDY